MSPSGFQRVGRDRPSRSTRRSTKVLWRWRVSGDFKLKVLTLSSAAPGRLRMHGPTASNFALAETRAMGESP
jgi:hypothetical protein